VKGSGTETCAQAATKRVAAKATAMRPGIDFAMERDGTCARLDGVETTDCMERRPFRAMSVERRQSGLRLPRSGETDGRVSDRSLSDP